MPISTRQTVNLQEIFNLIDKKGKGSVEASTIGDLLRYAGLNPTEKTCTQIIGNCSYFYTIVIDDAIRETGKESNNSE